MKKPQAHRHGNRTIVSMLMLRQGGRCFYCNRDIFAHADENYHRKATLDHKTPLSLGGEPYGDNVVASCVRCNAWKGMLDAETFMDVQKDHVRRKELIREAQAFAATVSKAERDANRRRLKAEWRESLIRLQLALRPVVQEYRRQFHAGVVE